MRTTRKLSERAIKGLKPRPRPRKVADGDGLHLLITPAGGKLWRLKYRTQSDRHGKRVERLLALGQWPAVSLAEARDRTLEARRALARGEDPGPRRVPKQSETIRALVEDWASRQGWADTTERRERSLMTHWLPRLGESDPQTLSLVDVREVLLKIEEKGSRETAHRVRAQIGRVLRYAVAHGRAPHNVAADLVGLLAPVRSEKYSTLTDPKEIGALIHAIDGYQGDPSTMYCLRLLPRVFTRPGELRNATWAEFDLDTAEPLWRIPSARMKMRRKTPSEHLVPLSRQVVMQLNELRMITGRNSDGLLFPGLVKGKPISDATLGQALKRLGYGPDKIVPHGFRAMASTQLNETGIPPDIIELQLAHKDSSVRAIYNRSTRIPERRAMMQGWSDYLEGLKASASAN